MSILTRVFEIEPVFPPALGWSRCPNLEQRIFIRCINACPVERFEQNSPFVPNWDTRITIWGNEAFPSLFIFHIQELAYFCQQLVVIIGFLDKSFNSLA